MAKESSASRRARVKFQLRDRKGRWIEMGRGVKWYSPRLGREVSGTVVGSKGRNAIVDITSEPAGVTGKPQQVSVKGTDIEVIANKASIGAPTPKPAKQDIPTEKAKLSPEQAREQARNNEQSKTNNRKSSAPVADTEEDEDLEEIPEDPDVADLEEVDVDEDLGEDEASGDEDVDTSPTSVDDLEATIEELEAVVEEVASGDLDAGEIDAKLAEEVYTVYGNDGKQYDLDVKKSDGKWNYRLKDAGAGETRALIPADDNDSVDAGAKLNAAMNPKSKAKATTAVPKVEEKTEAPEATPKPEVETPKDSTPVPEGEQDELFPKPKSKAPGKNATDMKKELDALPDDTRIHFSDAMGENSEVYQKVTTNPDEGKPKTLWAKVGVDEKDDDGGLEVLDGSDYKQSGQLEKEREALNSAGIAKKHAGREFETDSVTEPETKGHMAPVEHRPLAKDAPEDPAKIETDPKSGAVKAPEGAAAMLKWRNDMRKGDKRGLEIDDDNNVTVTDPEMAEEVFDEAMGDTRGPSNRLDVHGRSDDASLKELTDLREKLGVPNTSAVRREALLARMREDNKPAPTAPEEETTPEAPESVETPETPKEDAEPVMTMTLRKGKTRSEIQIGIETQETDSRDPGLRIDGNKLEVTDYENAKFTLDGPIGIAEDQLDYGNLVGKERSDTKAALTGLRKVRAAIADHEEASKSTSTPETAPEAPQNAPESVDTPEEQKTDTTPEGTTEATPAVESDEGAAALASVGVERTEPRALPGEKFAPTRQQQDVIDAVMAGKDTVVQAKAGAGKTTTLQAIAARIAEAKPDDKIVYVAFNSSVQKEAEARMPGNVEARTGHSIGFGWVGKDVNDRYKSGGIELDEDVAKHIGITGTYKGDPGSDDSTLYPEDIAAAAVLTVDKYAYNAEDDINEDHLPDSMLGASREAKAAVIDAANKVWDDVKAPDGKIKLTQDHMRKMWALSRPDFGQSGTGLRRKADMLFIDEAQDTPPVLAKVVADQKMQKVIVGDQDQAIYGFSGATDFLSKAEKDIELPLNRSWRFGAPVADAGNRFLELLGSKGRVVGGGNSKLSDGKMQDADAVLVRTNAGALGEMVEEGSRGRIVGVEKKTIDKFNSAADTMDWLKSKNKGQTPIPKPKKVLPELAAYKDWEHVERENEKGDKPNLAMYVRLDGLYGSNGIREALKNVVAVDSKSPGKSSKGIGGNLNGVDMDDNGETTVARGNTFMNKDDLKAAGFVYLPDPSGELFVSGKKKGTVKPAWQATGSAEKRAKMVEDFGRRLGVDASTPDAAPITPDVIISTAHKAKGLEWKKVRIGDDFPQPKLNKATGKMVMPDPENLRLAYVAVTRAESELDPGSLGYVYEHTKENGGTPEPADKPAEQNEVTEPPISAVDDSDFVPESDDRVAVADTEAGAAPEAPQAPEVDEVADESVPEANPEAPEAAPEPVEAPEPTPAPAVAPEPVEAPEEPAPEATTPDDAAPVDGLDDDGLTPAEASYAGKLQKAISDGYRTGIGNIQALQERLDEIYDRGAARQRGEDPDAPPEAAPEVKPAENKEPATPEAEEEVVPEAEEVVEAPEPTPEAPVEAEAEPVEVVEDPTEGPQGDASDGEEDAEAGPTDLDSFEATASELFETFTDAQKTPRTPAELQDILDEEVYLLVGEDGANYEFGLSIDDKGAWHYVLSDDDGNELERYNVVTVPSEEAGQKAFERVNGSQESETAEEAPVDPADATPEAEEETVDEADRVEPEEAPEVDPEVVPEPAPMPEVEVEDTAPEAQTPDEAPQETPEAAPEGGTAPAEPDDRPLHPVKQKAHNYPDGTQIKAARTDEVIEKTKGKWHVVGHPNKAADPMGIDTPLVVEMPKQPDDAFEPFDGNMESLVPGDIIRTTDGHQAAVIGTRGGMVGVMPHGVPPNRKALQPNTRGVDPSKITGVIKFDAPAPEEEDTAPAAERTRTKSAGGAPIMDVDGNETKLGDRVMTAIGQGEVIALRPKSGPNGSVLVRLDDGKEKSFRSNKFTNAAFAELLEADNPATMEIGAQGTAEDGRKFLVGKGNKPIYKGDRVELADGRIGTVAGIYAGVKSAGVTMEDGSTTRKKVSTLDAIDYTAPEKDTAAPEDAAPEVAEPTPEVAPEVETTVDTPEVEADVDEGPSEIAFEYSDSEMSQLFQAHMEVAGFTAESFIQSLQATGSKNLMREWEEEGGASALSTLMAGEGSEQELYHAIKKLDSVVFGGIFYSDYADLPPKNARKLRTLREQLDEIAPIYTEAHMEQLNSISEDTPGKVTDVTNYSADDVDFSGFDWTTSKFNPNSEKAQAVGDADADMMEGVNLRSGTKVRNKLTGEYGTISALHSSQLRDGNHTVFESTGPTGEHNFISGNWAADEIEVAEPKWATEAGNFDHVADVESLAKEMSSMYPDVGFDFSGLPLDYAKEAATNISRLAAKYPMLRSSLTAVRSREMPAGVYASASRMGESTYGVDYAPSVMSLNTVGSDRARTSLRTMSDEGWLNPIAEGNEIASTVSHEMGHILENLTGEIKEEDIAEILKSLYPQYRPNVEAVYRNMFRAGILPRYPVAESQLDVAELMAEAFADAELNATDARPLSKLLHQYLMERLQEG